MSHPITRQDYSKIVLRILLLSVCLGGPRVAPAQSGTQPDITSPLTLSKAIELALKQNRALRLAALSVKDAQEKKSIARSAYFPQIKNESSMLYVTQLAGVEIPTGAFGSSSAAGPIPARNLFIGQGSDTTFTSGTGLAQPFTQMLKIREANRAASADITTAKIQLDQAQDDIALRVMQLYYGLLIGQRKLQAATAEVSASQLKWQEAKESVARGQALEVESLESHAALLDAKQTALTQTLHIHDLRLALNDLLGLPLAYELRLDESAAATPPPIPSREECLRIARQQSPEILAAQQAVMKAQAGLAAAKDAYIPDVTGLARYSYQSGVPLLVHNFGTFGLSFNYELFEGGRRNAEIRDARTLLSEAEISLVKSTDELTVELETAYDKVLQMQNMVDVAAESRAVRAEAARLADRQLEESAVLESVREEAHSKLASAEAAYLEATLGLSLAQGELRRTMGQIPR